MTGRCAKGMPCTANITPPHRGGDPAPRPCPPGPLQVQDAIHDRMERAHEEAERGMYTAGKLGSVMHRGTRCAGQAFSSQLEHQPTAVQCICSENMPGCRLLQTTSKRQRSRSSRPGSTATRTAGSRAVRARSSAGGPACGHNHQQNCSRTAAAAAAQAAAAVRTFGSSGSPAAHSLRQGRCTLTSPARPHGPCLPQGVYLALTPAQGGRAGGRGGGPGRGHSLRCGQPGAPEGAGQPAQVRMLAPLPIDRTRAAGAGAGHVTCAKGWVRLQRRLASHAAACIDGQRCGRTLQGVTWVVACTVVAGNALL